tara:strand:- start:17188 stop:18453 length:1266 start_codon:yes stop_codon:yes gene_type:complete
MAEKETQKNKKEEKKIKILNQGTFGCIFRPGITCEGTVDGSEKTITKVQKSKETSQNEIHISNILKDINGYNRYFAPIKEFCNVDISTIMNDELRKCKFIEKSEKESKELNFEINKISYVGKKTLGDYFKDLLIDDKRINKINFGSKFIFAFNVLVKGLNKLSNVGVVHHDIKENNIVCKANTGRPIYIDFGLSIDMNLLDIKDTSYFNAFYTHAPVYPVWCFEINIMNYLLNVIGKDMETVEDILKLPVSNVQVAEIIKDFLNENETFKYNFDDTEKEEMIKEHVKYLEGFTNQGVFTNIKWEKIVNEIMKTYKTWDLFSLGSCFLLMIEDFSLQEVIDEIPFLKKFEMILKNIVSSVPNKRVSTEDCLKELKELEEASIKEINKLKKIIKERSKNKELIEKIRKGYADSKMKNRLVPTV